MKIIKTNIITIALTVITLVTAFLLTQFIPLDQTVSIARASTGGSVFSHIKTWNIFLGDDVNVQESTFAGTHYDIVGGKIVRDVYYNVNPNGMACGYFNVPTAKTATGNFPQWISETGYNPEDFILHYTEDTNVPLMGYTVKGWRAACSPSSCTPAATATSQSESRVPGTADKTWSWWNLNDSRLVQYLAYQDTSFGAFTNPAINCYYFDSVPQYGLTLGALSFTKTDVYPGIATDNNHPHITKLFTWGNDYINYIAATKSISLIPIVNITASSVNNVEPFKSLVENNYDWDFIENWSVYTDSDSNLNGVAPTSYESDYDNDIVQIIAQTHAGEKRMVRGYQVIGHESDRGKIFVLANYYLINNANTYFSYQPFGLTTADEMPSKKWYNAIGYDIGQPKQNASGQADYAGNQNTTEHYQWATGADPANGSKTYHILARRYDNALVLVKYRPSGSTYGDSSATVHQLDQAYFPLQADGTLGAAITQITLRNNEAAILIPDDITPPQAVTDLQAL